MKRIIGIPFPKKSSEKPEGSQPPIAPPPPQVSPPPQASPPTNSPDQQTTPTSQNPPLAKQPGGLFNRLWNKAPQPGLSQLITSTDNKVEDLERKIAQCETDLKMVSIRLRKVQEGSTKANLRAKAQGIIQRKKRFEQQAETLRQQSFNFEQTNITLKSTKDAVQAVVAMKQGVKELKKAQKKVNLESVEDLHDELEQLFETSEDVQDVLASDLNMPIIDDKELEEQLELLGEEFVADGDASYLDAAQDASFSHRRNLMSVTPPHQLGGRVVASARDAEDLIYPVNPNLINLQDPSSGVNDILFDPSK